MREYLGDIHFIFLGAQTLAKKRFSFKVLFITRLATIAFILDIYL